MPSESATINVLALIWTSPFNFEWRAVIRSTLLDVSGMVPLGPRLQAGVEMRFAVGRNPQLDAQLAAEERMHSDLALLNMTEEVPKYHSGNRNGKLWYTLEWAVRNRPRYQLICKQDHDALVDWRGTLPALIGKALRADGGLHHKLQRLYVGWWCDPRFCPHMRKLGRCAVGVVEGFSLDVAEWIISHRSVRDALTAPEDVAACTWADTYDAQSAEPINRDGIIPFSGSWAHPLKGESQYLQCFYDRGCTFEDPPGSGPRQFRMVDA